MKKKILFAIIPVIAMVVSIVGISAFEAHVINVTATIENTLYVPVEERGLNLGTVFPEEVLYQTFDMRLSDSFMAEGRVDDVEYMLRQKPKCGVPVPQSNPVQYSEFVQVTDGAQGAFVCPEGSVMLPLLCPYLSKTELSPTGATTTNAIAAFHGPLTNWTLSDTIGTQLLGRLSKADGKTATSWLLDLHAPCFKGECAQDNVIPAAYQADPTNEHQLFGCDLWLEVTNISTPPEPEKPTLTVNKVVVPSNDPGKFDLQIDSITKATDVGDGGTTGAVAVSPGSHSVGELAGAGTNLNDYTVSIGGDCASDGSISLSTGDNKTCTITNTINPGHLIVHKVVITHVEGTNTTAKDFQMTIDGNNVDQDVPNIVTPGNHIVGEVSNPNYAVSFSAECPNGLANVPAGETVTCTVSNEQLFATLTLNKVVNNIHGGNHIAANFDLFASGNDATTQLINGVPKNVAVGSLFINEQGVTGYQAAFTGDCDINGQITLAAGENKQCTITNTDIAPSITLVKAVDSGSASPYSFALRLDGNLVAQNSSVPVTSNSAHAITEDAHTGYHWVSIVGTGSQGASCPGILGGTVTLNEGETITCIIHNAIN